MMTDSKTGQSVTSNEVNGNVKPGAVTEVTGNSEEAPHTRACACVRAGAGARTCDMHACMRHIRHLKEKESVTAEFGVTDTRENDPSQSVTPVTLTELAECEFCTRPTRHRDADGDPACGPGEGCAKVREPRPRLTLLTVRGETLHVAEWARRAGLDRSTICHRLRRGWSSERAVSSEKATGHPPPRFIEVEGERLSILEWARRLGVSPFLIRTRLHRGWSEVDAVTLEIGRAHV